MAFSFDIGKMDGAVKKGKSVIYSQGDKMPFFDLRKKEGYNVADKVYRATVRLVVKEGATGFGYRVMHKNVGMPGKSPKSFTCPRFLKEDADCPLCEYYAMSGEEELSAHMINWPSLKDGVPYLKATPLTELLKKLEPNPRLIFIV